MALDGHKNFAVSAVTVAPSPPGTGTTLTVRTAEGALFPAAPFQATIWPAGTIALASNAEVVRCTAKSGDVLTITRGQEGSLARSIVVGDQIAATFTAKMIDDIATTINNPASPVTITETGWSKLILRDLSQPVDKRLLQFFHGNQSAYTQFVNDAITTVESQAQLERASGNFSISGSYLERGRSVPQGFWTAYPYSAGNFTATSGTWTVEAGDQINLQYMVIGKTLWLAFYLATTAVSGTPTGLRITLPAGYTAASTFYGSFWYTEGGAWALGATAPGSLYVTLQKDLFSAGTWTTGSNTYVAGIALVPVA